MKQCLGLTVMLVALTAHAADLRVRLFSVSPPVEIEVVPTKAGVRTCPACKSRPIEKPLTIVAAANVVYYDKVSAQVLLIEGTYRLRANGTTTMELDAPLEVRSRKGQLLIVAQMAMEPYVAMALGGEAGGIKSPEALKAIAVAIRTYAAKFRGRHAADGFDLCDSTHCQVLRSGDINLSWRAAADDTAGEMLWYEGKLAYTYHHASCGGTLEDGRIMLGRSVPYLRQQTDTVCATAGSEWDAQIDKPDLRRALLQAGFRLGTGEGVAVTDRDRSGRVRRLLVDNAQVDATSFRMAIGRELGWNKVRSELYEVSDQGESVIFRGRGRGHGVGLCQTGAELRGLQGANYRDILSFYFRGTTLGVTAGGLRWTRMSGERIELQTTSEQDQSLLASGERILRDAERRVGWRLEERPQLRVYPTVAIYRDSTGEPGWVAASTVGRVIRLQPLATLKRSGTLESTLRHEFLHMLVEKRARSGLPLWFREGVVLYLSGQPPRFSDRSRIATSDLETRLRHPKSTEELRSAYAAAGARVADLAKKYGESAVLQWIRDGIPTEAALR